MISRAFFEHLPPQAAVKHSVGLSVYTAGFPLGQAKSVTENSSPALVKYGQKKTACRAFRTEMRRVGRVDFNCLAGSAEYFV